MTTEAKIIWLASYPKSGNTWVRFLLSSLLFGSAVNLEETIPDIHHSSSFVARYVFRGCHILKTHRMLNDKHPYFAKTAAYLYIVRNPLDVLLSNLNYGVLTNHGRLQSASPDQLNSFRQWYIGEFLRHRGDARWSKLGFGSWNENIVAWTENLYGFSHLVVRYEDLLANTEAQARRICAFFELEVVESVLQDALSNSSFESMKRAEERAIRQKQNGVFYAPNLESGHQAGLRFLSKGQAGYASQHLTREQLVTARESFAPYLEKFGYLSNLDERLKT